MLLVMFVKSTSPSCDMSTNDGAIVGQQVGQGLNN